MVEFSKKFCPNCGSDGRAVTLYANNTCSHCGAPPDHKEMEIKRNLFVCPSCGAGNINYETIFPDGTCAQCGAAPNEVGIMATAEKVRVSGQFGLVLYADEARLSGKKMEKILLDNNVEFINVEDLFLRDVELKFKEAAMKYFVSKATRVFIIISPGLDADSYFKNLVEYAVHEHKLFPLTDDLGGEDTETVRRMDGAWHVDVDNVEQIKKGINFWFQR
ncbi:MAG: zinc ribbon domain-containing protein [Patescibacteria group bacterium]